MPVIELSESETHCVDRELILDYASQLAIEDRRLALKSVPGALERAEEMWFGRATTCKSLTLRCFAHARVLPTGERAKLPALYWWVRCPVDQLLILFWGEEAEQVGDRVRLRMPYEPLPRYLDPYELDTLRRYLAAARERSEGERFAGLDLS